MFRYRAFAILFLAASFGPGHAQMERNMVAVVKTAFDQRASSWDQCGPKH